MQIFFQSSGTLWMMHTKNSHKIDHKTPFLQISHLSSNRRVHNLTLYFQFTTPARELTHSMNFGHAMFLHYLEPEKCKKEKNLPREQHEFQQCHNSSQLRASKMPKKPTKRHEFCTKLHSLTPATMPRKVLVFFHNFAHRLNVFINLHLHQPKKKKKKKKQQLGNT